MSEVESEECDLQEKSEIFEKPAKDEPQFPYRIDWYQTESHVVVTIFRKKENQHEKYDVSFRENALQITALKGEEKRAKIVHLEQLINPDESTWAVLPAKIEIKMKKKNFTKWNNYEVKRAETRGKGVKSKNWDELVSKIEEEKLEGEALLNKFFGDIYEKGSDEVKRAMIKSFYESGGTELNTDWGNVSSRRVEVKPPDGMEWKPWNK